MHCGSKIFGVESKTINSLTAGRNRQSCSLRDLVKSELGKSHIARTSLIFLTTPCVPRL